MTNGRDARVPGNYVSVNGLNMYYEIHGAGRPWSCFTALFRRSAVLSKTYCRNSPGPGR